MYRGKSLAVFVGTILLVLTPPCSGQAEQAVQHPAEPKITDVRFVALPPPTADNKEKFKLAIVGDNLGDTVAGTVVRIDTKDPAHPVEGPQVLSVSQKEVVVEATAPVPSEITAVTVTVGGKSVSSKDLSLSVKANPPAPALKAFQIKLDHQKSKEFPNLHTLVLTKEGGDTGVGFDANSNHMRIDLLPIGATDLNVVQTNEQQVDLHFVAAADYEPQSAIVTVYDSSDLDHRRAVAVAKPAEKAPAEDPAQPKITGTEIVFINRSHGVGRIRIYGKGFGDYDSPPYPVDDYLWNCLEEFHIRGTKPEWAQDAELKDIEARITACAQLLKGTPDILVKEKEAIDAEMAIASKAGDEERQQQLKAGLKRLQDKQKQLEDLLNKKKDIDDKIVAAIEEGNEKGRRKLEEQRKQLQGKQRQLEFEDIKKLLDYTKTNLATYVNAQEDWEKWGEEIREKVMVSVNSRNPDIQVERVEILDINDKMVDVYFEFTRYRGYAWPFRLGDGTVTVKKTLQKTTQTVKNEKVTGTVTAAKKETYSVAYQPGPKRDPNLTYKYTVLDKKSANTLLGKGIADNFYVLQVSVVNNSDKKVMIPLSAIQAEVEWLRGKNEAETLEYMAGPPTLAPIPLAAVSAYFDAYQKSKGPRAILFNTLDGLTTLGAALVPFTGPSFEHAQVVFAGGFIQGLHKALGDLSGQQLQNLTALSWESSETLPAKGGSIEKLVYIQKNEQFSSKPVEVIGVTREIRKQISNIMDLEITGFEVTESEAKQATPTPAKPAVSGTTPTPSQTTPSPAPAAPAKSAQPKTPQKDKKDQ